MVSVALAPTLSHLLAAASGNGWSEVCTASGSRWVAAGGQSEGDPAPGKRLASQAHCPLCMLGAALGQPPAYVAALLRMESVSPLPSLPTVPTLLLAWSHAQPRAPPAQA